jgi:hypothetical protein
MKTIETGLLIVYVYRQQLEKLHNIASVNFDCCFVKFSNTVFR